MNSVSDRFHELANADIRPLDWNLEVSWTKEQNPDADPNALPWDTYNYSEIRDRVIELTLTRSVQFPYNIQSATLDIALNNYDGYLSFDSDSPIAENILPARPIRAYLGFQTAEVTPVFVGLTEDIPEYSGDHNTTASLTAMDFLATIGDLSLTDTVMMQNVRTDEVIDTILGQFGLDPSSYELGRGANTIPFVYFSTGKNAANALKELVQAENGSMWIDETGTIRFEPRSAVVGVTSSMLLTPENIVSISPSRTNDIVNRVYVESDTREIKEYQSIFSADNSSGYQFGNVSDSGSDPYRLGANGSTIIWISFDDPIWSANLAPVLDGPEEDSNFTAVDLDGVAVSSKITATGELFAETAKLTFTNTNNFPVSVNFLQIWGEPAKVIGTSPTLTYTAEDKDSIERFGTHELSITDNNCFGNASNIDSFATDVLTKYSGYSGTLDILVKGDPALQLHDIITIDGTNDYDGTWLVQGAKHKLTDAKLETTLTVVRQEEETAFILDVSKLNSSDVLS